MIDDLRLPMIDAKRIIAFDLATTRMVLRLPVITDRKTAIIVCTVNLILIQEDFSTITEWLS